MGSHLRAWPAGAPARRVCRRNAADSGSNLNHGYSRLYFLVAVRIAFFLFDLDLRFVVAVLRRDFVRGLLGMTTDRQNQGCHEHGDQSDSDHSHNYSKVVQLARLSSVMGISSIVH